MLQIVDRTSKHTIHKVTTPKLDVHFQTIETDLIGKGGQATAFATLHAARESVGKVIRHPAKDTAPARSYAQQQKGFSKST